MAILAILLAVAYPSYSAWRQNAGYKQAARELALIMRDARSRAISTNLEHRVSIEVNNARYRMERGNLAYNSSAWPVNFGWISLPGETLLQSGAACDQNSNVVATFFPNGSSDSQPVVCVMAEGGNVKFKVMVGSQSSGRVVIE
ncbi:hypothetical protein DESUT3_17110 [Desulfuromonas versatilis]|uniref:Type II secretion system protein H n=1 Tax=Desulfuromonas versatilis TaxID=2802975 RepID=A0ABM8HV96_9BACT|nr:hypothetical protein DESUT3_17110 [Desulfuromonas versatilis]